MDIRRASACTKTKQPVKIAIVFSVSWKDRSKIRRIINRLFYEKDRGIQKPNRVLIFYCIYVKYSSNLNLIYAKLIVIKWIFFWVIIT